MLNLEILKVGFLILFSGLVWGSIRPNIPEEEIRKALSHTVFILSDIGICHGVVISPYKVLTAAHCLDHIKADDLEDLRVVAYIDSVFFTSPDFFEKIAEMRNFAAECLTVMEDQSFCSMFAGDDSLITVADERPNLQWSVHIHQTHAIYTHPNFEEEVAKSEDSAVVVLKDPAPFSLNIRASIENNSNNQSTATIDELSNNGLKLSDPPWPMFFNSLKEEKALRGIKIPPLDCFLTDWRIPNSVYQPSQLLTFETFINLMNPVLNAVQEELDASDLKLPLNLNPADIFKGLFQNAYVIAQYKWFFEDGRFTPQHLTDYELQKGYSGGPLWCYSPETGLFLKSHVVSGFSPFPKVFFTRNFDEDLYQWVEEQK